MKYHTYLILSGLTACIVASLIGWSIATGFLLLPVIAIPLGVIVILACRQHVDIILKDDRVREIRSLSALRTLEICIILGTIGAVILTSYILSEPLFPKIEGRYLTHENGTTSLEITLYRSGFPWGGREVAGSTLISNVNAMNEFEAMEYSRFKRESFQENERNGLIGMTLAFEVISLLTCFGIFNIYYGRKY